MEIRLTKKDLVVFLNKGFDLSLTEESVGIVEYDTDEDNVNGLAIYLKDIPLEKMMGLSATLADSKPAPSATEAVAKEPPPPDGEEKPFTVEELMALNNQMAGRPSAQRPVKDATPLKRVLGPNEYEEPPEITEEELRGGGHRGGF
jgi:hypothetical protein